MMKGVVGKIKTRKTRQKDFVQFINLTVCLFSRMTDGIQV